MNYKPTSTDSILSERMRALLDRTPVRLMRCNAVAIAVITAAIILVALLVPYPHGDGRPILDYIINPATEQAADAPADTPATPSTRT